MKKALLMMGLASIAFVTSAYAQQLVPKPCDQFKPGTKLHVVKAAQYKMVKTKVKPAMCVRAMVVRSGVQMF